MKSSKKPLLLIATVAVILCMAVPFVAYAGTSTGGGFGGGSGEVTDRFNWYTYSYGNSYEYADHRGTTYGDGEEQASLREHANDEGQETYTRLISYATTRRGAYDGGELRHIWTTKGYADWENIYNWGADASCIPSELRYNPNSSTEFIGSVETMVYNGILYRISDGATVAAVWVDPAKEWQSKKDTQTKEVLVYVEAPGTDYDTRNQSEYDAKWQWDNGITESDYSYTTKPNETNVTKVIKYEKQKVKQIHTWEQRGSDGSTRKHQWKWEFAGNPVADQQSIRYTVDVPNVSQTKYTPLNLNRNGYATPSDIGDGFTADSNLKIDATVDNKHKITDNSPIKSLDINNDTLFDFKFNNNTYGMPGTASDGSVIDWDTKPYGLANGTWEDVTGSYCNGKSSPNYDESFRYDLTFKASTTSLSPSVSTSSLVYGDSTEVLANETPFTKVHNSVVNAFTGNDGWSVRFNLAGNGDAKSWYYTDNGSGSYPYWWMNTYSMSKYYEYGTSYYGKITVNGVQEPISSLGGGVSHGTYNNWVITTDVPSHQRGLYIGESRASFNQPVLTGKWDIKTLAGDLI